MTNPYRFHGAKGRAAELAENERAARLDAAALRAKPKIATRGACADKGEPHDFDPTSGICRKCHTYA